MTSSEIDILGKLILRYEAIGVAMYDESLNDTVTKYNKLYRQWRQTVEALDAFGPDGRVRIRPFLSHPNLQLRMNAAYDVEDIDPQGSLAVFRGVAASGQRPQSVNASLALERRDPTYKG
jgi:hypothetical protein